jgi:hypothetical protein
MPKVYQGSTIADMFITKKMIILTLLDFPDPDKAHWCLHSFRLAVRKK